MSRYVYRTSAAESISMLLADDLMRVDEQIAEADL
jgi:hypothetical protein